MKAKQDDLVRNFLLGKLTDEEQTKIEEDYFKNNSSFENILIAENELIDAYVTDTLSSDERTLFEKRLLINPQQKQRVEFAQTLVRYASSVPLLSEDPKTSATKSSWLSLISQYFSARPALSFSFAAFALIFFGGAIWWTANNNLPHFPHIDELASTQTPAAETDIQTQEKSIKPIEEQKPADKMNKESETVKEKLSAAKRFPKADRNQSLPKSRIEQQEKPAAIFSTIILPLGLTRDAAPSKAFEIPAKADFVNLQLTFEEGEFISYFVVLETVEGQQIWSGKITKSAKSKSEKAVTVTVPGRLLKEGDYILTLKGLTKERAYETAGEYSFTVDRR